MLRQSLIYLLLSILIVVFAKYAYLLVYYVNYVFTYINVQLTPIFSQTGWGIIVRKILVLMAIPLIIVGIPALIYWAVKRREMPYFIPIVWVLWIIIVLSNFLLR